MLIAVVTNKTRRCCRVHTWSRLPPLVRIIWCLEFVQKNKNNQSEDMGKAMDVP